jgi:methionyl-tRNA formyltransferase
MPSAARPFKIAFFGTPDFAVPVLDGLRADGDFSILEVVTQPDRPAGRGKTLAAPAVKRAAVTYGLPVYQPVSLRTPEALEHFKRLKADAYVVVSYGKILPKAVLELPPYGGINVHGSVLPSYRGASPISAAIAAGEKETGISIMKMDEKLDEGPVLAVSKLPIKDDDTTETLSARLAKTAAELLVPTLKLYLEDQLTPKPQDHALATYTRTLVRDDGRVAWDKSAEEIERFARAMQPWPTAFSYWRKKGKEALRLAFKKVSILHPDSKCDTVGRPGSVCKLNDGRMGVNCGRGSILVHRLQIEGKAETDGEAFLNGYPGIIGAELA